MISNLKKDRKEQEEFLDTIETVRLEINNLLPIHKSDSFLNEPITEAANYSLKGDGKRLRPTITWIMGITEYGLKKRHFATATIIGIYAYCFPHL